LSTAEVISVFITASSRDEAEKIAQAVVEENLATCATLLPGAHSIYRWNGKIEHADECVVILKTRLDKFDVLQTRVKQLHSYDCPCIVAWPIVEGSEDYLNWVRGG
jgi:periplasmic divalent cation tolerance protein